MQNHVATARPFAIAAFETAAETNAVDHWETALSQLSDIVKQAAVAAVIANPIYDRKDLGAICIDLAKSTLTDEQINFVKVLAEADKLALLPDIKIVFDSLKATSNQTVDVTVSSVEPLTDAVKAKLKTALQQKLQREPVLSFQQNPDLIGGLFIQAGDTVIDGSVKTTLQRFKEALEVGTCN